MSKSYTLTVVALDAGICLLALQIFLWDSDPWKVLVGFGAIYGWLTAFTMLSVRFRRRQQFLLAVGALPLGLEAAISLFFSYPFHLIPAFAMLTAVIFAKNEQYLASQTAPGHPDASGG